MSVPIGQTLSTIANELRKEGRVSWVAAIEEAIWQLSNCGKGQVLLRADREALMESVKDLLFQAGLNVTGTPSHLRATELIARIEGRA